MLKGVINIYEDPYLCFNDSMIIPNSKIISLDEEDSVIEMSSTLNPAVIKGSMLLPPIEALWAEADGDENAFNSHYYRHLIDKDCVDFFSTLITFVYNGGSILIFTKELNNVHIKFLYKFFLEAYGLDLGIPTVKPFGFDIKCIPIYLISMYQLGTITPQEFLLNFPFEIPLSDMIYVKLILDLDPYASIDRDIMEKKAYIDYLRFEMIRTKKILVSPIHYINEKRN